MVICITIKVITSNSKLFAVIIAPETGLPLLLYPANKKADSGFNLKIEKCMLKEFVYC